MNIQTKDIGFTLLEVVIATFLLSLIALICGMALRTGIGVYEKIKKNENIFETRTINYYRIFDQLKHARQFMYKNNAYNIFRGTDHSLEFISDVSITKSGIPGFYRVKYEYEEGNLYIQEMRLLDPEYIKKSWMDIEKKKFITNIKEFSLKYLFTNQWYNSWSKNKMPAAIQVSFKDSQNRVEFIVPFVIGLTLK